MKVHCAYCGRDDLERTEKQVAKSRTSKFYCDEGCFHLSRRSRVIVQCSTCGIEMERFPVDVKRNRSGLFFCPAHAPRRKTHTTVPCANCGLPLRRTPYALARSSEHYCDRRCRDASPSYRAKRSLSAARQHSKNKDFRSAIEFTVAEHLERWGFHEGSDFITQKWFSSSKDYPEGRFGMNVDFYFPAFNLAAEMNGGYWHSDSELYDRSKLSRTQRKNLALYERKVRWIHSEGLRLIEVWERDNHLAEQVVIAPLLLLTVCQAVAAERAGAKRTSAEPTESVS